MSIKQIIAITGILLIDILAAIVDLIRQHKSTIIILNEADVELQVKKIVRDFGGMTACARLLTDHGCPITADGVDKWRRRGSIPTKSLIALTKIAHKRRQRFDLLDYI